MGETGGPAQTKVAVSVTPTTRSASAAVPLTGNRGVPIRPQYLHTGTSSKLSHSVARSKSNPGVNQVPLFTRECENPERENAGCGPNPDGSAWCPQAEISNLRTGERPGNRLTYCEMARYWEVGGNRRREGLL